MTAKLLATAGGKMWRTLDPEVKAPYSRRYKEALEEYRKELAAYKASLDSEE